MMPITMGVTETVSTSPVQSRLPASQRIAPASVNRIAVSTSAASASTLPWP